MSVFFNFYLFLPDQSHNYLDAANILKESSKVSLDHKNDNDLKNFLYFDLLFHSVS